MSAVAELRALAAVIDPCLVGGRDADLLLRAANELETALTERDAARVLMRQARNLISATHKNCVKHDNCHKEFCPICVGGLFICDACGAAEVETEERICTAAEARALSHTLTGEGKQ